MNERNEQLKKDTEAKKALKDLSDAHPKLFEKHFREWMERDGVARSLQAKLRCDLIANFNTTQLGKQLISQNGTAPNSGGSLNRLALSPLVLALNTLVAEFLYSQNCHFSLSVFCAEVPYRNTLPDFECTSSFRFTKLEIAQIMEAISGSTKCEDLKKLIVRAYEENTDLSLMFCILKYFVEHYNRLIRSTRTSSKHQDKAMQSLGSTNTHHPSTLSMSGSAEDISGSDFAAYLNEQYEKHEIRRNELTSYRLLNKYLMILTKRVKEMVIQCERIYLNSEKCKVDIPDLPTSRIFKSASPNHNYQAATRALDNISKELKQLRVSEHSDKDLFVIASCIQGLSQHFDVCSNKFEDWRKTLKNPKRNQTRDASTETDVQEKSYSDWIKEMRTSKNGKKFLDKIATSIQKALEKQKSQLQIEADVKLQHQAELLKIHYKQKYIDQLTKNLPKDKCAHVNSISERIEKQLQQYEQRYQNLLAKLTEIENNSKTKIVLPLIAPQVEKAEVKIADNTIYELKETNAEAFSVNIPDMENIDQSVKQIVSDVQMRLKELDSEGNRVENEFQHFLERQREERDNEKEVTQRILQTYVNESHKIIERYELLKSLGGKYNEILEMNAKSYQEERTDRMDSGSSKRSMKKKRPRISSTDRAQKVSSKSDTFSFKNAITEAKDALNLKQFVNTGQTQDTQVFAGPYMGSEHWYQPSIPRTRSPIGSTNDLSYSKDRESEKHHGRSDSIETFRRPNSRLSSTDQIPKVPMGNEDHVSQNELVRQDSYRNPQPLTQDHTAPIENAPQHSISDKEQLPSLAPNGEQTPKSRSSRNSEDLRDNVNKIQDQKEQNIVSNEGKRKHSKQSSKGNTFSVNDRTSRKTLNDLITLRPVQLADFSDDDSNDMSSEKEKSKKRSILQQSIDKMEKLFLTARTKEFEKSLQNKDKTGQPVSPKSPAKSRQKDSNASKGSNRDVKENTSDKSYLDEKQNKENIYDNMNSILSYKDQELFSNSSSYMNTLPSHFKASSAIKNTKFKIRSAEVAQGLIQQVHQGLTQNMVGFCDRDNSDNLSSSSSNASLDTDSNQFLNVKLSTMRSRSMIDDGDNTTTSSEVWINDNEVKK